MMYTCMVILNQSVAVYMGCEQPVKHVIRKQ